MNCKGIETSLLAVVDGRATAEARDQVKAHLAICGSCAQRMEELRTVWASLDRMEGIEPSAAFDAHLRARMAEQPARSFWRDWLPAHMRLVAVMTALVIVAAWISVRPLMHRTAPVGNESQEDFAVVKNLPVLENYDVISNFDALSALPGAQTTTTQEQQPIE